MRNHLIELIEKESQKKNLFFLTGDLGFSVLEKIKKKMKRRFINAGVAENNMFLLANGISVEKKKYYIFIFNLSVSNFKKF